MSVVFVAALEFQELVWAGAEQYRLSLLLIAVAWEPHTAARLPTFFEVVTDKWF